MKPAVIKRMIVPLLFAGFIWFSFSGAAESALDNTLAAERSATTDEVAFIPLDSGTSSGITSRAKYIIKDEAQWLALWRKHTSNTYPPQAAPHVDFSTEMVIAVFAGEHHKSGCSIQIDSIKKTENKIVVLVSETGPGAGVGHEFNGLAGTQPYFIVRAAQNTLPITFQGI